MKKAVLEFLATSALLGATVIAPFLGNYYSNRNAKIECEKMQAYTDALAKECSDSWNRNLNIPIETNVPSFPTNSSQSYTFSYPLFLLPNESDRNRIDFPYRNKSNEN